MRYEFPVDDSCPKVKKFFRDLYSDPYTQSIPGDVIGDIAEDFEKKHRASCERCQKYGVENVGVI